MPDQPPPQFVITTPVGEIALDPTEIRDVWAYVSESVGVDIQDEQIKVFLGDSVETKRDFYHSKSYVGWGNSMMEVVNRDYEIVLFTVQMPLETLRTLQTGPPVRLGQFQTKAAQETHLACTLTNLTSFTFRNTMAAQTLVTV